MSVRSHGCCAVVLTNTGRVAKLFGKTAMVVGVVRGLSFSSGKQRYTTIPVSQRGLMVRSANS